ncbi:MAG: LytTR family transcriptional regulator, partial [Clostridia bacterium]|nr:LytTR family transcriptional regulator [Clostridia bacterium]
MKISIKEDPSADETEVIIVCRKVTIELEKIIANLSLIDNTVAGNKDGETHFIPLKDIFYFESVDGKIFFYTEKKSFECQTKLYQLEENLESTQ